MSRVEAARARLGVTALAFVARASIDAIREHPALNAWLEGERYTRHRDVNLGIAVSLGDDGLIVPVMPRAHELSVEGLAARIKDLARRARARQLTPDDVRGGTFTITNPGQYGSIMATPIINQPQVAILDFEAVIKRPVVVTDADGNDSIAIRPMTILGLSWDHRALDGALAAQFLASVKRNLESVSRDERAAVTPEIWVCHLGMVEYREALELQERDAGRAPGGRAPRRAADARAPARVHARAPLGRRASCRWARSGTRAGDRDRRDRPRRQGHLPRPRPARRLSDRPRRRRGGVRADARAGAGGGAGRGGRGRARPAARTATGTPASGSASGRSRRSACTVARREHARVRGQRRERPAAVQLDRAVRARRRADDVARRGDGPRARPDDVLCRARGPLVAEMGRGAGG